MTQVPHLLDTGSRINQSTAFPEQEANQSGGALTKQGDSQSEDVLGAAFSIIAGSAFVFNLAFCVVLLKKRAMLRKPHNTLLFNLAITDLLTGEIQSLKLLFYRMQHERCV